MSTLLKLDKLNNTRDMGGMRTGDGRVIRPGALYRSGHLYSASDADRVRLRDRIGLILDLRTDREREEKPDPALPGVREEHIPILSSLSAGVTRDEASDKEAFELLAQNPGEAMQYMCRIYAGFVADESCRAGYRRFLDYLLDGHDKGVLWHCTAGKDRAGFAAVIVGELLGVERAAIERDYLDTNGYLREEVDQLIAMLQRQYRRESPEIERSLRLLFGAEKAFLRSAYAEAEKQFGDFGGFLSEGLRLSGAERKALQARYLKDEN